MSLWNLFINLGTQPVPDFCWMNHWKWLVADHMMGGSWISVRWRGLDYFLRRNILPKLWSVICLMSLKMNNEGPFVLAKFSRLTSNSELLKVSKMTSLKISSHGEARNIKFGQQINLIQGVHCLRRYWCHYIPHIHVTLTNLFISSQRGYCYHVWAIKTTPW